MKKLSRLAVFHACVGLVLLMMAPSKTIAEAFLTPDFATINKEPNKKQILSGKDILEHTAKNLPQNVKARMNCTSCHLNSGTEPNAGPFVGVTKRYPSYYARDAKMETLKERINNCFERSMNGKALREDSKEMAAIMAYMTWISKPYKKDQQLDGLKMKHLVLDSKPDLEKGKAVYLAKCIACHQADGQGLMSPKGEVVFPPLWGNYSFNIGAGMAHHYTAAGFVKAKMPLGQPDSLTDEEAWNVAAYFIQQPRPDFAKKKLDWPQGDKPKDARY